MMTGTMRARIKQMIEMEGDDAMLGGFVAVGR
jgi:hypothetical protein